MISTRKRVYNATKFREKLIPNFLYAYFCHLYIFLYSQFRQKRNYKIFISSNGYELN